MGSLVSLLIVVTVVQFVEAIEEGAIVFARRGYGGDRIQSVAVSLG